MVVAPESGAPETECVVCTGPRCQDCGSDHVGEAFVTGMIEGILAVTVARPHLRGGRAPLCVDHETMLREGLVMLAQGHPEVFDRLGVEYRVAP